MKVCANLPIIRKVVRVGGSRGVTLPATWLQFLEQERGERLEFVVMEVNGDLLIRPYDANIKEVKE